MKTANELIKGTDLENASLEDIIKASKGGWVGGWVGCDWFTDPISCEGFLAAHFSEIDRRPPPPPPHPHHPTPPTHTTGKNQTIFNNAAQAWSHDFYWKCMTPSGGGAPHGKAAELIERDFGSYEAFKTQFEKEANSQFGSGWGWLAQDAAGKLSIVKTSNADLPLTEGLTPLLTVDV